MSSEQIFPLISVAPNSNVGLLTGRMCTYVSPWCCPSQCPHLWRAETRATKRISLQTAVHWHSGKLVIDSGLLRRPFSTWPPAVYTVITSSPFMVQHSTRLVQPHAWDNIMKDSAQFKSLQLAPWTRENCEPTCILLCRNTECVTIPEPALHVRVSSDTSHSWLLATWEDTKPQILTIIKTCYCTAVQ